MILLLLAFAIQDINTDTPSNLDELDPAMDCLDTMTKAEIKNVSSDTPQKVVDIAFQKCDKIINEAVAKSMPQSSKDQQTFLILSQSIRDSLRKPYEENIELTFLVPEISEYRTSRASYE